MVAGEDLWGLGGRKALVVGGGDGMGHETVRFLSRAGADVVVVDRAPDRAETVRVEAEATGVRAVALTADVTAKGEAARIVTVARDALGGLDVVVNIVGGAAYASLLEVDDDTWDAQQTLNLRQQLDVARAAAEVMMTAGTGGAIALVASVSGIYAAPLHGAYGAAKAALMSLVRTMSQEWGPAGIRVNAVAPDGIATPRVKANFAARGAGMEHLARDTSLKRHGEARDVAGVLTFLVSDLAAFVTGQTIIVDGGVHASLPHKMDAFENG